MDDDDTIVKAAEADARSDLAAADKRLAAARSDLAAARSDLADAEAQEERDEGYIMECKQQIKQCRVYVNKCQQYVTTTQKLLEKAASEVCPCKFISCSFMEEHNSLHFCAIVNTALVCTLALFSVHKMYMCTCI